MRWFLSPFLSLCARSCMMVRWQRWRVINENRRRKKNRTIIINVCSTEWMKRVLNAFYVCVCVGVVFSSFRVKVVWPGKKEAAETTLRTKSLFVKYFFCAKFRRAISHTYTSHTNTANSIYYTSFDARTSLIKFLYFFSDFDSLSHYYTSMATMRTPLSCCFSFRQLPTQSLFD